MKRYTTLRLVGMLLLGALGQLNAQVLTVKGRVTEAGDGKGLPGVTIQIKGTGEGTVSDNEGEYVLQAESRSTLIFSFVGMKSMEIEVESRDRVDVAMEADVRQLSELVVTGTGTATDKRNIAFEVESVEAKGLPGVPSASLDQALIGRIPGAQISSVVGTPGSEVNIILRGINTVNGTTQPIIMVDGIQMGASQFSALDPSTVERVEVIQGAAASTIYGAQGANGVIQVFTKKGKKGGMSVDFSFNAGVSEVLNIGGLRKSRFHGFETDSLNQVVVAGTDTIALEQDPASLIYNGVPGYDFYDTASNWNKPYGANLKYFDHMAEFLRPANYYSASISLSGGGEKSDFAIGFSKTRQESTFSGSGYNDRTNFLVNLGFEVAKGLKIRSISQLVSNQNTISVFEKPDFGLGQAMFSLLNALPFAEYSKKDIQGNFGSDFGLAVGINSFNPYYHWQYSTTQDSKIDILQNLSAQYAFPRFVDIEVLYGINHQSREIEYEVRNQSLNKNSDTTGSWIAWNNFSDNKGEITNNSNNVSFQNFKTTVNVRFDLAEDFKSRLPLQLTTMLGFDFRQSNASKLETYALGMPVLPPASSTQGSSFGVYQDYEEEFVTYGYLVNQRVDVGRWGGISAGFRSDYSSAFGKGSDPFTFPRLDGYLRISSFNFWNEIGLKSLVSEWKVRGAYGEAGIQPHPYDRYVTLGSKAIGASSVLFLPQNQNNSDLDVEVSKETEIGTDLHLTPFKGIWLPEVRLSGSYWTRSTDNAIYRVDLPPSAGGTKLQNAVGLKSNGLQASLSATVLSSRNFRWDLTLNASRQESMVSSAQGGQIISGDRIIKAGEPIGQFYGWMLLKEVGQLKPDGTPFIPMDGAIDPVTNQPYDSTLVQSAYEVASNGWVVNKLTKRPFISTDRYSIGNPNPDFLMSVISDFSFKDLVTFSFQFDGMFGQKMYNEIRQWMYRDGIHSDYEKPITINNQTGAWTAFYQGVYNPTAGWEKNYFVEDGTFVRLRSVSVGFDFARVLRINYLRRFQVVLTGRNLWTRTSYSGQDPEVSFLSVVNYNYEGFPPQPLSRGIDRGALPNSRTYQITLNIGF